MKNPGIFRHYVLLTALAAGALMTLVGWGLSSPPSSAPDDDYHLASIWCVNEAATKLCDPAQNPSERLVSRALLEARCFALQPETKAICQEQILENPYELVETGRGNFVGQYPGGFYSVMSLMASDDIAQSVFLMRIFNAFLAVLMIGLLAWMAPNPLRTPIVLGLTITAVPLALFLIPSTNPSSWAVISAATLWAATIAYFQAGDAGKKSFLAVLLITAFALGASARADAALYSVVAMAAAGLITFVRRKTWLVSSLLPLSLSVIAVIIFLSSGQSSAIGGIPATPEVVAAASEASLGGSSAPSTSDNPSVIADLVRIVTELPQFWLGIFGYMPNLGWLDTEVSSIVWASAFAVFASLIFVASKKLPRRSRLSICGVAALLVLVPVYFFTKSEVVVGQLVQPRYVLPLIVLFAGLMLYRPDRFFSTLSKMQLIFISSALVVANAVALLENIGRYLIDDEAAVLRLGDNPGWWLGALEPLQIWFIGVVGFATFVASGAYLLRRASAKPFIEAE